MLTMPSVKTESLEIHYLVSGPDNGWPVILSHGFPYSPSAFRQVTPLLVARGARVLIPFLRGYGPTRFLSSSSNSDSSSSTDSATTPRTGQQAALATDLIDFLDALGLQKAILAGFDWGGVASCAAAALFPERVQGLVCYGGYDIYDPRTAWTPVQPGLEKVMWYQHLFQSARGEACLSASRREVAKLLWAEWSPTFAMPEDVVAECFAAFANPDFVSVVVAVYRHSMGSWAGETRYAALEARLAARPAISVAAITVDGRLDPLKPGGTEVGTKDTYVGRHEHWTLPIGHAFPLEAPEDFARAVLKVRDWVGDA